MTVEELIHQLNRFDETKTVRIFDSEWGYIDIEEVFRVEGTQTDKAHGVTITHDYIAIS